MNDERDDINTKDTLVKEYKMQEHKTLKMSVVNNEVYINKIK